jgi:hypothetical protein
MEPGSYTSQFAVSRLRASACRHPRMAGRLPVRKHSESSTELSDGQGSTVNSQLRRTVQEAVTTASAEEVITYSKVFFARRNGIYAAFLEKEGPGWVNFRGQGGEEIVIGTAPAENGTRVTASTYLFDQQVARFLAELPAPAAMVEAVDAIAGVTT